MTTRFLVGVLYALDGLVRKGSRTGPDEIVEVGDPNKDESLWGDWSDSLLVSRMTARWKGYLRDLQEIEMKSQKPMLNLRV